MLRVGKPARHEAFGESPRLWILDLEAFSALDLWYRTV